MTLDTSPETNVRPNDATVVLVGQCYCRAVTYEVADEFEYAANCHCSDCRRATGSAFKPFAGIKVAKIAITSGNDDVKFYGGEVDRNVHCNICGSLLFSVVRNGAYAHVTLGTLVDAPRIEPQEHIFVRSKAPWYEINDALPQYQTLPGK